MNILSFSKYFFMSSVTSISCLNLLYFNNIPKKDRINLIFDLDETLINSKKSKYAENYNLSGISNHDYIYKNIKTGQNSCHVWKRPFVDSVLFILSKYNNLYLLTRGGQDYATDICYGIEINDYFIEKKFRNDINLFNKENNSNGKNLTIFNNINIANSILIDDLKSNNVENQRFIHVTPYSFCKRIDFELIKLLLNVTFQNTKYLLFFK